MKTRRANTITLEIPQNPLPDLFAVVHDFADDSKQSGANIVSKLKTAFKGRYRNAKNIIPLVVLVVVALGAVVVVARFIGSSLAQSSQVDNRVEISGPRAKADLGKSFGFPLVDDKGKEIAKLKFLLDKAELRDEIILDGQKAIAPKGTTYLIITIELTNDSNKFIEMKVRNYVRLSKNGDNKLFAAGIHNDPVEVQPQSTKQTRLGFPVSDTDSKFILRVGDLEGKKTVVPLDFK